MSVLNTLNVAVACLRQKGPSPNAANDLITATAAVVELIEAAAKLADNDMTFSSGTQYVDAKALRAALAKVRQ